MMRAFNTWQLILLILLVAGCEKITAYGRPNELVVAASTDLLPIIEDSVVEELAPIAPPLRRERTFRITFEDPTRPEWGLKRLAREVILIGFPEDPVISQALETARQHPKSRLPSLVFAENIWARNQNVTILLLDPGQETLAQALPALRELGPRLKDQFREGVERRMFVSGKDELRRDSLLTTAGFSMVFPRVYEGIRHDSLFIFRNDNPSPQDLIRQVTVSWRSPIPGVEMGIDSLLEWREEVSEAFFHYPQVVVRESVERGSRPMHDLVSTEIRGTWANPPGSPWPAGGPFLFRTVVCPAQDRLYLVDAWLYSPEMDKWEYLLQIETILQSFHCGAGQRSPAIADSQT